MLEIERQFLIESWDEGVQERADRVHTIRQAYLTVTGPAIRVRQIDERTVMTVKSGGGLVRREVEFDVEPEVAQQLFEIGEDRLIEKTRYVVGRWELDVFEGRHEGLRIAEVELTTEDEPTPEVPTGIALGLEVTHEPQFTNQFLSGLTASEARALVGLCARNADKALEWVRSKADGSGDTE